MNINRIAQLAHVSRTTVSRVINHVDSVDPELAKRVQAVIQEVGYHPNYHARALVSGRSRTVGLVVSELSGGNPFFSEIILYFERAAVEQNYEVLVSFTDNETIADNLRACVSRLQGRGVEGVAVLTFGMEEQLAKRSVDIPMVYAGANPELKGIRNVRINYQTGFRDAIEHLAGLGHRRIGYLSGQLGLSSMKDRYRNLCRAMRKAGLGFDQELVAKCDHTWLGGALGMVSLLNLPKPPTAVLCCNDAVAVGALRTLSDKGLQAGKDIALIGFDDLTICQFTQPSLSTIRFSPREIACLAFCALLEEIQRPARITKFEYKTRFIPRESTCALAS